MDKERLAAMQAKVNAFASQHLTEQYFDAVTQALIYGQAVVRHSIDPNDAPTVYVIERGKLHPVAGH